jgi:NAD+ kinase
MARIAMVAHRERGDAGHLVIQTHRWLVDQGHEAWLHIDDAHALLPDDVRAEIGSERPLAEADLVVSLGGDGTMLRAVQLLGGGDAPLLGVNLGWLGYLTEVEAGDVEQALGRFLAGSETGAWSLDERMMLDVEASGPDGAKLGSWTVLNEAVVEKRSSGNTVRLAVHIDGSPFTSYATDGLIVSTPTGSTAYSLSARGPVVSPKHRAMLLTPVAPHMLFDRSLVLDPTEVVEIIVVGHRSASLVADGQTVSDLHDGARVTCRPSRRTARFVRFGEHRYHQILKAKFGLLDR